MKKKIHIIDYWRYYHFPFLQCGMIKWCLISRSHFSPSNMVTTKSQFVQTLLLWCQAILCFFSDKDKLLRVDVCASLCQADTFLWSWHTLCASLCSSTQVFSHKATEISDSESLLPLALHSHLCHRHSIRNIHHYLFNEVWAVYNIQKIKKVMYLRQLFWLSFQSLPSKSEILLEMRN